MEAKKVMVDELPADVKASVLDIREAILTALYEKGKDAKVAIFTSDTPVAKGVIQGLASIMTTMAVNMGTVEIMPPVAIAGDSEGGQVRVLMEMLGEDVDKDAVAEDLRSWAKGEGATILILAMEAWSVHGDEKTMRNITGSLAKDDRRKSTFAITVEWKDGDEKGSLFVHAPIIEKGDRHIDLDGMTLMSEARGRFVGLLD